MGTTPPHPSRRTLARPDRSRTTGLQGRRCSSPRRGVRSRGGSVVAPGSRDARRPFPSLRRPHGPTDLSPGWNRGPTYTPVLHPPGVRTGNGDSGVLFGMGKRRPPVGSSWTVRSPVLLPRLEPRSLRPPRQVLWSGPRSLPGRVYPVSSVTGHWGGSGWLRGRGGGRNQRVGGTRCREGDTPTGTEGISPGVVLQIFETQGNWDWDWDPTDTGQD